MKHFPISALLLITLMSPWVLTACVGLPNLSNMFYPVESDKPDYARGEKGNASAEGRAPLDVPPELRDEVNVPMPDAIATEAASGGAKISQEQRHAVAGKAVSLDARIYDRSPAQVFSTVIDAMTALNMPVQSVDSPSGTVTTEWIRNSANSTNSYVDAGLSLFGGGPTHIRYRFVIRVLRTPDGKSRLEIRTLGQKYVNRHWVNKPLIRKNSNELFAAVEERLIRSQPAAVVEKGKTPPPTDKP